MYKKTEKGDSNQTRRKYREKGMKQLYHVWCYPEDELKIKNFILQCNQISELAIKLGEMV